MCIGHIIIQDIFVHIATTSQEGVNSFIEGKARRVQRCLKKYSLFIPLSSRWKDFNRYCKGGHNCDAAYLKKVAYPFQIDRWPLRNAWCAEQPSPPALSIPWSDSGKVKGSVWRRAGTWVVGEWRGRRRRRRRRAGSGAAGEPPPPAAPEGVSIEQKRAKFTLGKRHHALICQLILETNTWIQYIQALLADLGTHQSII